MLFRNYTPFPPLQFESRDEKRNDFGVIVLRGTFKIENGRRLRLVQEQAPLIMADEYFGEPGKSSLKFESNIAPYKPKTDVLVQANAHAPSGRPMTKWNVGVEVAGIKKGLTVTGPREWNSAGALSPIKEARSVPIRYELAYGGQYQKGTEPVLHDDNPVGRGFVERSVKSTQAPQIFPLGSTDISLGGPIPVAGLGPVAPSWTPRRDKAGTFNLIWEKTRWPDLPEDFSFEFYNTGSDGLTLPGFAKGDERIKLTNLSTEGEVVFGLPNFQLATLLRFEDGRVLPGPIHLDTIHIDMLERRVYLNWRGVFPVNVPLRVLEVRMNAPKDVIYQPEKQTANSTA